MVCNAAEGRLPFRSARFREQKCCKCQPLYGDVDDMMMLYVCTVSMPTPSSCGRSRCLRR